MRLYILFLLIIFLCSQRANSQTSLYEVPIRRLDSSSISLQQYAGKKICFLIVPLQADSSFAQIKAFCTAHANINNLVIIGVPSLEDGYTNTAKANLQQLYTKLPIVLTTGIYTRKSAESNQGALLKWLTDVNRNRHFDNDVSGIGDLFFVSEAGVLYSVLYKGISIDSKIMDGIINQQVAADLPNR